MRARKRLFGLWRGLGSIFLCFGISTLK